MPPEAFPPAPPRSHRALTIVLVVVILLALGVTSFWYWKSTHKPSDTTPTEQTPSLSARENARTFSGTVRSITSSKGGVYIFEVEGTLPSLTAPDTTISQSVRIEVNKNTKLVGTTTVSAIQPGDTVRATNLGTVYGTPAFFALTFEKI